MTIISKPEFNSICTDQFRFYFDISKRSTGLVITNKNIQHPRLCEYISITNNISNKNIENLIKLLDEQNVKYQNILYDGSIEKYSKIICFLYAKYRPIETYIENYAFGKFFNSNSITCLSELNGIIKQHGNWIPISPKSHKTKQDALDEWNLQMNLSEKLSKPLEDLLDAWTLITCTILDRKTKSEQIQKTIRQIKKKKNGK